MSGYSQTLLVLSAFDCIRANTCLASVLEYLVRHNDYSINIENDVSGLVFDTETGNFIDTIPIETKNKTLDEIQKTYNWVGLYGDSAIGDVMDFAEIYLYPAHGKENQCGISICLSSQFYEAIYEESGFNEEAKHALVSLCLGVAGATDSDGFVLLFDLDRPDKFGPRDTDLIRDRLLHLDIEDLRKEPKLLTGIRNTLVSKEEVEAVWGSGESVYETTNGYVILDIMLPHEIY